MSLRKALAYEKAIMALHDPRYGDQLKGQIKLHNHTVEQQTVELLDRYRYTTMPKPLLITGLCEVCKKPVHTISGESFWRQIEERAVSIDSDPTHWTNVGCHDLQGHQSCLFQLRKAEQGVQL